MGRGRRTTCRQHHGRADRCAGLGERSFWVYARTMSRSSALLATIAVLAVPAGAVAKTVTVTERSDGKRVVLAKGDKLVVKLTECRPCGYLWHKKALPKPAIIKQIGDKY